jgi:hypothetical protein
MRVFYDCTDLRSVTWTKVSLKDAKMRATPKTSSPEDWVRDMSNRIWLDLTFSDLGTQRDVLGGGALDLLLGRHLDEVVECVV